MSYVLNKLNAKVIPFPQQREYSQRYFKSAAWWQMGSYTCGEHSVTEQVNHVFHLKLMEHGVNSTQK